MDFDTVAQILAALAAMAALILALRTYLKQRDAERESYVILRLDLRRLDDQYLLAETCLENKSVQPKTLTHVILLVCPFDELPNDAFNELTRNHGAKNVTHLRDFPKKLDKLHGPIYGPHRILVPMDYYTLENSEVADEILTFDVPLDISSLDSGRAYSVRLILYGPERLHRVVQRGFVR